MEVFRTPLSVDDAGENVGGLAFYQDISIEIPHA